MPSNLRIISDNAIHRAALFTADTTSGTLVVANLLTDIKSEVHRATQKSVVYKARWNVAELIGGIFLPYCNLSDTATIRVRLTSEAAATNMLTYSEVFTNGAWVATNTTVAGSIADPAGGTAACTITAGSATPKTLKQTLSAGSSQVNTNSIWLRRRTGSGTITLWSPDGATSLVISGLPSTWTRYSVANAVNSTARSLSVEFATTGDAIDAFASQMELGLTSTSYYPTTSAAATRPLGYTDSWQSYAYDSGIVSACPGGGVLLRNWTNTPIGANAYSYGGGACARHWLSAQGSYVGISVDVNDPNNVASYVEASRMVIGSYWSPIYNAEYEAPMTPVDRSTNQRNDAGDLVSIQGTKYRKQSINLAHMPLADRDKLWDIVWGNGSTIPIMFSLYPNDPSGKLERTHQIYGKLPTLSAIATPFYYRYSSTIDIEEV